MFGSVERRQSFRAYNLDSVGTPEGEAAGADYPIGRIESPQCVRKCVALWVDVGIIISA